MWRMGWMPIGPSRPAGVGRSSRRPDLKVSSTSLSLSLLRKEGADFKLDFNRGHKLALNSKIYLNIFV